MSQCGVAGDAVWALGDVRDGDGDELFGLLRQRPGGEHLLAELVEGAVDFGRQLPAQLPDLAGGARIDVFGHGGHPFASVVAVLATVSSTTLSCNASRL